MEDRQGRGPSVSSYPKLIEFFESIIANKAASLRMRLTAAKQLDAILTRMERREASEVRRAERTRTEAARAQREAVERESQPTSAELAAREAEQARDTAVRKANEHLEKIMGRS